MHLKLDVRSTEFVANSVMDNNLKIEKSIVNENEAKVKDGNLGCLYSEFLL